MVSRPNSREKIKGLTTPSHGTFLCYELGLPTHHGKTVIEKDIGAR